MDSPINAEVYTHRDPNEEFDMESSLNDMDSMMASESKQAYGEEGMAPVFYECGSCGGYHPSTVTSQELGIGWNGDCRDPKGTMDPDTIYANHPGAQLITLEDQMAPDFDDSVLASADEPKTASPEGVAEQDCECSDPGCPVHQGVAQCLIPASMVLYRVDMEDVTGTAFCDGCGDDAMDSGVFRYEEGEEPRLGEEEMNYFASAEKTADVADNEVSEGSDSGSGGAGEGNGLSPTVDRHEQYNEKQAGTVTFKTAAGELPAKRIKRIPSHVGLSRYMDTLQDTGKGIPKMKEIPSPYAYSPEHTVYRTQDGREVFIVETKHKTYDVFEVPAGTQKHPLNSDFNDGTGLTGTEGQDRESYSDTQDRDSYVPDPELEKSSADVSSDISEAKSETVSPDTVDADIKQPTESVEEAGKRASAIDADVAQARKAVDANKKELTSDSASTDTVNPAHFAAERHDDVPVSQGDIPAEKESKSDLNGKGAPEAHDVPPQADSKVACPAYGDEEDEERPFTMGLGDLADFVVEKETDDGEK